MFLENIIGINSVLGTVIRVLLIILLGIGIYISIKFSNERLKSGDKIYINRIKMLRFLLYVSTFVIIINIFYKYPIIRLTAITCIISVVIAYILNPAVNYFESKGIKRAFSIALVYFIIALVFVVLFIVIIPKTINQFKALFLSLPDMFVNFTNYMDEMRRNLFANTPLVDKVVTNLNGALSSFLEGLKSGGIFEKLANFVVGLRGLLSTLLQMILIPVVTFYLLLEKDKICRFVGEKTPKRYKKFFKELWKDLDYSFSMFVRGRILMAIFVGIATALYLSVLGIEFALVIGIITCIADIIPYIGPFMGFVPAVLLAFIKSPIKAIWVGLLFMFVQWVENNIIGPKILGDSTGMHPLIILIVLIIGGGMYGVMGMIFSVPIASAIKIIYEHTKPYIKKYLFSDKLNNETDKLN